MAAYTDHNQSSNCCTAAASSSAPVCKILDTACALAVSIFICLISRIDVRLRIGMAA